MLQFSEDIMIDDFNIENLENFFIDKYVWIKDPLLKSSLANKYLGPFEVLSVDYPVITINRNGEQYKVNIDRIKPARFIRQTEVNEPDNITNDENSDDTENSRYIWTETD